MNFLNQIHNDVKTTFLILECRLGGSRNCIGHTGGSRDLMLESWTHNRKVAESGRDCWWGE